MDTLLPPMNPEVARLRRQSAQRKYRQRLRAVRLLWLIAGVLLVLLLVETVVALCFSPRFRVYRIAATGQETLTEAEIIRLMALPAASNFYRTSPARLAARVEAHPRVERAEVRRGEVGVLQVTVRERRPAIRLGLGQPPLYIDREGVAFTRPAPPSPPVPIVEGCAMPPTMALNGRRLDEARVIAALDCLDALRDTAPGPEALAVARMRFEDETGYLTLVLPQGALVFMGRPRDLTAKAWVAQRIAANVRAKGQSLHQVEYIDVQVIEKPTDVGATMKFKQAREDAAP